MKLEHLESPMELVWNPATHQLVAVVVEPTVYRSRQLRRLDLAIAQAPSKADRRRLEQLRTKLATKNLAAGHIVA